MRKKQRVIAVLSVVFGLVFLGVLYGQAIIKIKSGDLAGGRNYYGQPVGAYLQLAVAIFITILIPVAIVNEKKKRVNKHGDSSPQWMQEPPFKWPWK